MFDSGEIAQQVTLSSFLHCAPHLYSYVLVPSHRGLRALAAKQNSRGAPIPHGPASMILSLGGILTKVKVPHRHRLSSTPATQRGPNPVKPNVV